ncbi:hypothetical protein PHPALM_16874 [Phytophthora palmivora]|uniref:Uncharacterized protein n=1 Tax=Phytophthora palmivora TaxID=4796 RepID=A0A2P4XNU4_9STRA|nr:hypothetical protein PHPALM_16874 [Phytophthora palmivora]
MDYSSLYLALESRRYVTRRQRVERPPSRINYFLTRMPDDEFRLHFRMTRLYFHVVCRAIANSLELQSMDGKLQQASVELFLRYSDRLTVKVALLTFSLLEDTQQKLTS